MNTRKRNSTTCLGCLILLILGATARGDEIKDFEIALTKGQYAIETRDYESAIGYLKKALEMRPKDRAARVSLAIAYSRTEEYEKAGDILQQVVAEDPKNARARYELGVVLAYQKQWGEANRLLASVKSVSESTELTGAAEELMEDLKPGKAEGAPSLRIAGGMQHDSNVILEPDAPLQSRDRKADWRGILSVTGKYPVLKPGMRSLDLGYRFYQSLHLELAEYNMQQHDLGVQGRQQVTKNLAAALGYGFILSSVGGDKYSIRHRVSPSATLSMGSMSRLTLHGSWEDKRYFDSGGMSGNAERSATAAGGGVQYTYLLTKETNLAAGYAYERDAARADHWDARAHRCSVTLRSRVRSFAVFGGLAFADRQYGPSPVPLYPDRHDRRWDLTAGMFRDLGKTLRVSLANQHVVNDSNLGAYEYRRNIAGLFLEMRL